MIQFFSKGSCDLHAIQIIKKLGGSLEDSFLDEGKNLKKLWHCGVIQLTAGARSSVWSGFEPSQGSVTARAEVLIS